MSPRDQSGPHIDGEAATHGIKFDTGSLICQKSLSLVSLRLTFPFSASKNPKYAGVAIDQVVLSRDSPQQHQQLRDRPGAVSFI
jgi:hypothetical protein